MYFLSKQSVFRGHGSFQGCTKFGVVLKLSLVFQSYLLRMKVFGVDFLGSKCLLTFDVWMPRALQDLQLARFIFLLRIWEEKKDECRIQNINKDFHRFNTGGFVKAAFAASPVVCDGVAVTVDFAFFQKHDWEKNNNSCAIRMVDFCCIIHPCFFSNQKDMA